MSDRLEDSDSGSDEEPELQLRDILMQYSQESAFEKTRHEFVPEGIVDTVVTLDRVKHGLRIGERDPSIQEDDLIGFIMASAKKIFAIAVFAKIVDSEALKSLKSEGYDDTKLPIAPPPKKRKKWTSGWRKDFCDCQWRFSAPVFNTMKSSHNFEEARILPFTFMSVVSGEGAFGQVSQTVIHPYHIIPNILNDGKIAVKEIKAQGSTQEVTEHWEREVKALRMMNELNQEHIVRFITAFRRVKRNGEEHYVMFEWADGGNLRNLWDTTPSPTLTGHVIKLVVDQIHGLAKALSAAHDLEGPVTRGASYRHGDLKPENILVFRDGGPIGKLKIGDWGEAKYHGQITAIRPSRTTTRFGTRRYEAPEVEIGVKAASLGQSTKRRSRLCDVWAMGCIVLEFIVWLIYGKKGLDQFNHDVHGDTFYTTSW